MREIPQQKHARLVKLIHVGKSQLKMDNETYRAMLMAETDKSSSTDMAIWELEKVLLRLRKSGFKPRKAPSNRPLAQDGQSKKIRALWLQLHEAGLVRNPSEAALNTYVKRQTGCESLQWLDTGQASKVIEALKKWLNRA